MASIQYQAVERLFRSIGVKKMLSARGPEFEALLRRYDREQKKPLKVPMKELRPRYEVIRRVISGTVCFVIRPRGTKPQKAVLYLFGGGYILPPDSGDLILCGEIAGHTGAEVWFPLYPMAPSHTLAETLESTRRVYGAMLKRHKAKEIRFFGTSSGGGQCLSLCMYMRSRYPKMPLPGRLVLQSPGLQVPPSRKQMERMNELSPLDVMIPPVFFESIAPVLAEGDDGWLLSPILADLTGYPPIDIFYGTHEVMIAYLEDFRQTCARCGVRLTEHIGEGMMHCWGAMSFVPEARAVRQEYFKALS